MNDRRFKSEDEKVESVETTVMNEALRIEAKSGGYKMKSIE